MQWRRMHHGTEISLAVLRRQETEWTAGRPGEPSQSINYRGPWLGGCQVQVSTVPIVGIVPIDLFSMVVGSCSMFYISTFSLSRIELYTPTSREERRRKIDWTKDRPAKAADRRIRRREGFQAQKGCRMRWSY